MNTKQELQAVLAEHYGSQSYFRHPIFSKFVYTEGVQCFLENAGGGAYWMIDILFSEPAIKKLATETGFALVTLTVTDQETCHLEVLADSGEPPVYQLDLPYTDCPEGVWQFYLEASEVGGKEVIVMLLPSEH